MTININDHDFETDYFQGNVILSDTDESGTSAVRNIVVLSVASYNSLGTKDSSTLYFLY